MGPLEARLQQPDVVILGSLNEGVWPRQQESGPWLSRPMREALGLPAPEQLTGRSAHDFAQGLGAETVYLTRAMKVEGVPTVASRWLRRLLALVDAAKLGHRIAPEQPFVEWARERDRAPKFEPAKAPCPCPPVEARPRKLSVTRIEKWIANPYEIFARNILKLERLKPLGSEPDAALRGQIVHKALHDFARDHPNTLPDDIYGELMTRADTHFAELGGSPLVEAFWRPSFQRFARWFAATEPMRRAGGITTFTEVDGALDIAEGFTLTARADRIDAREDGSIAIYDYKTGSTLPVAKHVDELSAPQLPLEARHRRRRRLRRARAARRQRPHLYRRLGARRGRQRVPGWQQAGVRSRSGSAGQADRAHRALQRPDHALRGEAAARRRLHPRLRL